MLEREICVPVQWPHSLSLDVCLRWLLLLRIGCHRANARISKLYMPIGFLDKGSRGVHRRIALKPPMVTCDCKWVKEFSISDEGFSSFTGEASRRPLPVIELQMQRYLHTMCSLIVRPQDPKGSSHLGFEKSLRFKVRVSEKFEVGLGFQSHHKNLR